MVTVTCEKTGIEFDAATKRTKNHPAIMRVVNDANKDGWYKECLDALKAGREAGLETIEEFVALLSETEKAYQEQRNANISRVIEAKRQAKEAKRQRYVTNAFLREHGYHWKRYENDEEDIDMLGAPAVEFTLYSPDGRTVNIKEAMLALAEQDVKFAKEWLVERNK